MNVLLITSDQHKATTIGAYGDPLQATPRLDAFAAQGTTYTRARTQNPFCQGARATILTGQFPSSHGVVRNGIDLPEEATEQSVATAFTRAGFATAYFGKAHFASYYPDYPSGSPESVFDSALVPPDWYGPYFGFEHVELGADLHNMRIAPDAGQWNFGYGPPPMGLHYARYLFRDGRDRGVERLRLMQPEAAGERYEVTQTWKSMVPEEDHPTTWITDRAIAFLEQASGPFFAWVSYYDPHHPFDPPLPWADRYDPADMVQVLPQAHPGEFANKPPMHEAWSKGFRGTPLEWANPGWTTFTKEQQLRILAYYYAMIAQIDHNVGRILDCLDARGLADDTLVVFTADHGDFMGEHQMLLKSPIHYESLVRVPFIVRGPGVAAGAQVDDPVGTIDLAPTFLTAAGQPAGDWMEGIPVGSEPREHILTEDDIVPKYLQLRTLTTREWRLTRDLNYPDNGELYDLVNDPGELVNLWRDPAYDAVRKDLLASLDDTMRHDLGRELPLVCSGR